MVRHNYSAEERKALVELVSYIKSIGSMMQQCDTLIADALWETVPAEGLPMCSLYFEIVFLGLPYCFLLFFLVPYCFLDHCIKLDVLLLYLCWVFYVFTRYIMLGAMGC